MRKIIVGGLAVTLGVATAAAGGAFAGTSHGQGAQKTALIPVAGSHSSCTSSDGQSGAATGFVILNAPGKVGSVQKIVGEVSLKNAEPNNDFEVELAQDGSCTPTGAILHTNAEGFGNAHINVAFGSASTYYVVLRNVQDSGNEAYASGPVPLQ